MNGTKKKWSVSFPGNTLNVLEAVEQMEQETANWKKAYNERVSESTERLLRIQKLEAEIAGLKARWEKLKELPRWSMGKLPNVGHCMVYSKTGHYVEFGDIIELSSGSEVLKGVRKGRPYLRPPKPKERKIKMPKECMRENCPFDIVCMTKEWGKKLCPDFERPKGKGMKT